MIQVELSPDIEKFIADRVRSGAFPTTAAVLEAAVAEMMVPVVWDRSLTLEELAELDEADAAIERGEGIDFDTFAAEVRAKYGVK